MKALAFSNPLGSPLQLLGVALVLTLSSACHGPKSYLSVKKGPLLSYSKSMCFGPCPAFSLTVEDGGRALYTGRANVTFIGTHQAQWPASHLETLAHIAAEVRLDQKAGVYDNPLVMDLPAKRLSFGGHEVVDRMNGPDLERLYTALDSLIKATTWAPEPPPQQ